MSDEKDLGAQSATEVVAAGSSEPDVAPHAAPYQWQLGDVFTNGKYRWFVDSISGDRAVLQSCDTKWARTIYLTVDEWIDGGKWNLDGRL